MANHVRVIVSAVILAVAAGPSIAAEVLKLRPVSSGYADGKGVGLKQPEGVACDGKSLVVVADTGNGRLVPYTFNGNTLIPGTEIALAQLPYPIRVQIGPGGEIFALDGKLRKIARISPTGEFKGYIDPAGLPSPGTVVPKSFQVDGKGDLYVLDVYQGRVLVLDPAGKYQREIPFPKDHGFFSDLAVDGGGNLFLIDSVGRRVFSASKDSGTMSPLMGSLVEDTDFPAGITTDEQGHLFIVDQNGGGIVILGRDGSFRGRQSSMGWKEGLLRYPSQICINRDGHVFVADRGNSRIQVFVMVQ